MADIDLNSLSRADLVKLRADIERAIAGAAERERRAAREAAEAAAREHGFSLADLTTGGAGASTGRGKGRKSASAASGGTGASEAREVRFRNPEDHSQTWSGRGRRPAWYNEAHAAGRMIEALKAG